MGFLDGAISGTKSGTKWGASLGKTGLGAIKSIIWK